MPWSFFECKPGFTRNFFHNFFQKLHRIFSGSSSGISARSFFRNSYQKFSGKSPETLYRIYLKKMSRRPQSILPETLGITGESTRKFSGYFSREPPRGVVSSNFFWSFNSFGPVLPVWSFSFGIPPKISPGVSLRCFSLRLQIIPAVIADILHVSSPGAPPIIHLGKSPSMTQPTAGNLSMKKKDPHGEGFLRTVLNYFLKVFSKAS